jgi:hypothetical protein
MRTRDFATKYIRFEKTSPVTGPFRLENYPFLGKPMDAADDIRVKRLVILKSSSCLGTVLGQIINAKRIACDVGDQLMVCQTEDDASTWTKTRGKEWLESIPPVMRLLKSDKYAQTQDLWLFRHKFLRIGGPGINAAQSVQVRYVQTDESHLEAFPNGRLVEFEKRMGGRFDAQATHITTAPDEGREVDQFYHEGTQEEYCWRCKCGELIRPLWEDDAKDIYNGERVFRWTEQQSETATLDSIHAICPHCSAVHMDNDRGRYALVRDGDYMKLNPSAPIEFASFQWSVFAGGHWIPWRSMLAEYRAALQAARNGDLKPHEDWTKKRLCRSYRPEIPDLGESSGANDYKVGDVWEVDEKLRVCSFDVQDAEGFHLWGQVDEFTRNGDSRRVQYARISTWQDARRFQLEHSVSDSDTYCDAGHRQREVFGRCAEWKWYALLSEDTSEFTHYITDQKTKQKTGIARPYSMTQLEDSMSGKSGERIETVRGIPPGYCLSRRWSKPVIGGYLMSLKSGNGRYYGIAKDINPDYVAQLNSYTYASERNKKTGAMSLFLKQIKTQDHAFATSSQCLLGAIIRGYYPIGKITETEQAA